MRHLATLLAAIVIAPLGWILLAFGQDRSVQAFANAEHGGAFSRGDFVRPLLLLAAAGVLLGLLGTLRFSPLGAVLTGAVYLGSYFGLLISPNGVLDSLPGGFSLGSHYADPATPLRTGSVLVLGALLMLAAFSRGRWRRWPVDEAPTTSPPAASAPNQPPARLRSPSPAPPDMPNAGGHWPDVLRDDYADSPSLGAGRVR